MSEIQTIDYSMLFTNSNHSDTFLNLLEEEDRLELSDLIKGGDNITFTLPRINARILERMRKKFEVRNFKNYTDGITTTSIYNY